eukprot:416589_1
MACAQLNDNGTDTQPHDFTLWDLLKLIKQFIGEWKDLKGEFYKGALISINEDGKWSCNGVEAGSLITIDVNNDQYFSLTRDEKHANNHIISHYCSKKGELHIQRQADGKKWILSKIK